MNIKLMEFDTFELGRRVELHLARENGGDRQQRLENLLYRSLRGKLIIKKPLH